MICAISFLPGGQIHFRSRFVRSKHRQEEEKQRKLLYRGQMGTTPTSVWQDMYRTAKDLIFGTQTPLMYRNPSNTNVYYWGGKVVSCYETSLPYVLDPTNLYTKGLDDFNHVLRSNQALAAHFRYDPFNDLLVTISLKVSLKKRSKLLVMEFDRQWKCVRKQELFIPGLNYAHVSLSTQSSNNTDEALLL
jgi:all-trans-8'-apo-beta-carotenal 15,15'-oxygenase